MEKAKLREQYCTECLNRGQQVLSDEIFTRRLLSLRLKVTSVQRRKDGARKWFFEGIGLREDEQPSTQLF